MNTAFITSMNLKLYEIYGNRFLNEFAQKASDEIKLFVMFEGDLPNEAINLSKNIILIKLINEEHAQYLKYFGKLNEANGLRLLISEENGVRKFTLKPDYRFNAIRFSFKPFSIYDSLNYIPENLDYLIWTDADLRCKKHFDFDSIKKFLPNNNELMSYLGRKNMYSECGFLGFHLKHNQFKDFINRIINIYKSGEIFSLEQWHDSWIWDYVRMEFENESGTKFKDISGNGYNHEHVYINSGLEEYFDHLKGPVRKKTGHSFKEDYKN